jgi:hypothetical protein
MLGFAFSFLYFDFVEHLLYIALHTPVSLYLYLYTTGAHSASSILEPTPK